MMVQKELRKDVDSFLEIESKWSLFNRKYASFPYWQSVRFAICERLYTNATSSAGEKTDFEKRSPLNRILRMWAKGRRSVWFSIRGLVQLVTIKPVDLLLIASGPSGKSFTGSWVFPPGISTVIYDASPSFVEGDKRKHYFEPAHFTSTVEYRIRKLTNSLPKDSSEEEFLGGLECYLKERFGQSMSEDEMRGYIQRSMILERHMRKYFTALLDKAHLKAIVVSCYYQDALYPLYQLAKERSIPVIELQHGVINNHEEYSFLDRSGINNYTPDVLLTFGEEHNRWIHLVRGSISKSIGYPKQEVMLQEVDDVLLDESIVMVYPQPTHEFEKIINDFTGLATEQGYRIVVKLHPSEAAHYASYYPLLSKNKDMEVITSQERPIYYWLKHARHHVMASTTVGLEAMVFDHANVCIATSVPHEQTQPLIDWGAARSFSNAEQLLRLIQNPIDDISAIRSARDRLWKTNARENMEAFFLELMDNDWNYERIIHDKGSD